mgnify:CR=1 FL=1
MQNTREGIPPARVDTVRFPALCAHRGLSGLLPESSMASFEAAVALGAEVTAVCSTRNVELVRSLGADHVIDYTREDFTKSGQQYDLILAVRKSRSVFAIKRALSPKGIYVSTASGSPVRLYQEAVIGPPNYRKDGKEIAIISGKASQKTCCSSRS